MEGDRKFLSIRIEVSGCHIRNEMVIFLRYYRSALEEFDNDFYASEQENHH